MAAPMRLRARVLRQNAPGGHDATTDMEAVANAIDSGEDISVAIEESIESALHVFSKAGDVTKIKELLARGADLNILSHKTTPLYIACYHSQEEAAIYLIEQGCDITQQDATHRSALMVAIERGLTSVIQLLLNHPDCDVTRVDRRKRNILHYAVISRNIDAIKMLKKMKLLKYLSDQPDRLGVYPIAIAAGRGYLDVMTALLAAGADPDAQDTRFPNSQTALQEAILNGHMQIVEILLKYGTSLDCKPAGQGSVICPVSLCLMSSHERADILQVLLEEGADVNFDFQGQNYTPLQLAVDQGYYQMAKMIVLAKCNLAANKSWTEEYMQRENIEPEREEFFHWLMGFMDEANKPNRLSYWCRDKIRERLEYRRPISDQISQLPVPSKLINFLLFRDVQ